VALLRAEGRTLRPWIVERIGNVFADPSRCHILDIGCGGGLNSNPLAKLGYQVTGIDLSEESLAVAREYDETGTATYLHADALSLPFPDQHFDVITAMDFLEHVEDPSLIIREVARLLKPGGLFFFHTFNRNPIAGIVVIKFVEWFVKNTSKNMHIYRMFLKPDEVKQLCKNQGLEVQGLTGIRPNLFRWNILSTLASGIVPENFSFSLVSSTLISYAGFARKAK
jgi:2-polyprenyl-6-hydroxyphenyl methylase/3-demethylubiquinone-9 3-methyltransferase